MDGSTIPQANGQRAEGPQRSSLMPSTLRCLRVVEMLAQEPYSLTLSEIARGLGTTPGSAHRFVSTLGAAGLVERAGDGRRYRLTGKTFWMGTSFLRNSEPYRCAYPMLGGLARQTMLMAHLGIWDSDTVLYLHSTAPAREADLCTDIGQRRPLHCTGLGKAMLANRPTEEVLRITQQPLPRLTERTLTDPEELRANLVRIRQLGYALDDEEGTPGIRCVAGPIFDRGGTAVAAISLSAPLPLLADHEIPRLGRLVREATLRASVHMGYRPLTKDLTNLFTDPSGEELAQVGARWKGPAAR